MLQLKMVTQLFPNQVKLIGPRLLQSSAARSSYTASPKPWNTKQQSCHTHASNQGHPRLSSAGLRNPKAKTPFDFRQAGGNPPWLRPETVMTKRLRCYSSLSSESTPVGSKPPAAESAAPPLKNTPLEEIPGIVETLRASFRGGGTRSLEWRRDQLKRAERMMSENAEAIKAAIKSDLQRDEWALNVEHSLPVHEIKYMQDNLSSLTAPSFVSVPTLNATQISYGKVHPEPLGTVLIIGPWNYPFHLVWTPAVAALAAGNNVVLKPSELSPATSALITQLVKEYFEPSAVGVVQGGVEETTQVLKERFDKICYTGNGTVGKIVMAAAAKHLCPVLLELGGKSPTYIDKSADLALAARRLAWGKVLNAGQTCVAPDYVLIHRDVKAEFTRLLDDNIDQFFPLGAEASPDYARIIAHRHVDRIKALMDPAEAEGASYITGGIGPEHINRDDKFIAPAVLDFGSNIEHFQNSTIMSDEIFGPVLPIVEVSGVDEAIDFIESTDEKPLAIYCFSNNATFQSLMERTSSGMATHNDCVVNSVVPSLGFGGVGGSGMGSYNAHHGFKSFTHEKQVLVKPSLGVVDRLIDSTIGMMRYPPYSNWKLKLYSIAFQPRSNLVMRKWSDLKGYVARWLLG